MQTSLIIALLRLRVIGAPLLLALFLGGCATATRMPLDSEKKATLGALNVIVIFDQDGLDAEVKESEFVAATSGGLFDLIAEDIRAKKVDQDLAPLRGALASFNFNQEVKTALRKALSASPANLALGEVEVIQSTDLKANRARLDRADGSKPLLVLFLYYTLNRNYGPLSITCNASFYPARAESSKRGTPLYSNFLGAFQFHPKTPGVSMDPTANLASWSANNAAPVRQALHAAAEEIAGLIAYDLAYPGLPAGERLYNETGSGKASLPSLYPLWRKPWKEGRIEHSANGRRWVRMPTGELLSIK